MDNQPIRPIPEIPTEIIDAVIDQKLVIFLGAGVSRIIGCKSWEGTASDLINICFNEKLINYKESHILSQMNDPKKVITICEKILSLHKCKDKFNKSLEESFAGKDELIKSHDIYKEIYDIPAIFVSTNADTHLHKKFTKNLNLEKVVYDYKNVNNISPTISKIYQIHGTILNPSSLVFTVSNYIHRYKDLRDFLTKIFTDSVVLFIGYGLGEYELIDFLISKIDSSIIESEIESEKQNKKNFILLPLFQNEEDVLKLEQYYYDSLGIRVIPYAKDENGYDQLYYVIKNWNNKISSETPILFKFNQKIKDAITNFEPSKTSGIFSFLKRHSKQEIYFLEQLALLKNPMPWFMILYVNDYFCPDEILVEEESARSWLVLRFLRNIANCYSLHSYIENLDLLMEILNLFLNFKNKFGKRVENESIDCSLLGIIFSLPCECISNNHIEFIRTCLTSNYEKGLIASEICLEITPKLLGEGGKEQVLLLLDIVLDFKINETTLLDQFQSIMNDGSSYPDSWHLSQFFKNNFGKINQLYGLEAAKIALDKLSKMVNYNPSKFRDVTIPKIDEDWEHESFESYFYYLIHFIVCILESSKSNDIRDIVADLLIREHPIFKKIAFLTISRRYNEMKILFWSSESNPLDIPEIETELYSLFELNCSSFTNDEVSSVINWIETKDFGNNFKYMEDEQAIEVAIAHIKVKWFYSILKTENNYVISKYEEYCKIDPIKSIHSGDISHVTQIKEDINTSDKDIEFSIMSNEEIINYFNLLETQDFEKFTKLRIYSFLENSVSENPKKLTKNLSPFLNTDKTFQNSLIKGFLNAQTIGRNFEWSEVLKFIHKILEKDSFWIDEDWESHYNNFIYNLSYLIFKGLDDKEHSFSDALLPLTEKILLTLSSKVISNSNNNKVNYIMHSQKYMIYSAMISYSLRCSKYVSKEHVNLKWVKIVKNDFTKRLDKRFESSVEFSFTIGSYLESLLYLDKQWVESNISLIFPKHDEKYWEASMKGFLFNTPSVSSALYYILRESENYAKAIHYSFDNQKNLDEEKITENLVSHICSKYLTNEETLENSKSLISQLLNHKNVKQLSILIHLVWEGRNNKVENYKNLVHDLWSKLYEILSKEENNHDYQLVTMRLFKWLEIFDEFDESLVEWLKLFSRCIINGRYYMQFVNNMRKYASQYPEWVSEIILESFNSENTCFYKEDDILDLVDILYKNGTKANADKICLRFIDKGYDGFHELYGKYNLI